MFECGIFTVVPDLPENPTKEAIDNWHRTEPKEYKFKLIDPIIRSPIRISLKFRKTGDTWTAKDLSSEVLFALERLIR